MNAGWLLVLVGALLLAAGCARPIDAAIVSSNAAAATLRATHATLTESRKLEQLAAVRRVKGDRGDAAVRAEMIDRAAQVGARYCPAWEAYSEARTVWLAVVAAIQSAQASGSEDLGEVERLLLALARQLQALALAHDEVTTDATR